MKSQITRRAALVLATAAFLASVRERQASAASPVSPESVILTWYKLILELVRHTPTYTPPVASRSSPVIW